jgi:hypothetical protein
MKTTLNLPEELYREVKIKAVREGVPVTELVIKGLQLLLAAETSQRRRVEFPLIPVRKGSRRITTELVRQTLTEMEEEEDRGIALAGRR